MHCYHLVTTENKQTVSIIKPAPPVPSARILLHTVLSQRRQSSIICPRTLD